MRKITWFHLIFYNFVVYEQVVHLYVLSIGLWKFAKIFFHASPSPFRTILLTYNWRHWIESMFHRTVKVSNHLVNYSFIKWFESRSKLLAVTNVGIIGMAQINEMGFAIYITVTYFPTYSAVNCFQEVFIKNNCFECFQNIAYLRFKRFLSVVWDWDKSNFQLS